MRLTVLGACGSFPGPDGACAGYHLEAEAEAILLDCGNGVLSRLQKLRRIEDLDAILVSHLHFDHMADLLVLRYGLSTKKTLGGRSEKLPLFLPATPEATVDLLDHEDVFAKTFIEDGMPARLGALSISFARMEHSAESYAIIAVDGERKLVYSGDTSYHPRLVDVAAGADLFLGEATGLEAARPAEGGFSHLTARQAAEVARWAGVGRLLLTHRWYEYPREAYLSEARAVYPGAELAEEWATYEV